MTPNPARKPRQLRRHAAAAGSGEEPVADLDDPAFGVEVMEGAPAENLTRSGLSHEERGEAAAGDQPVDLRNEVHEVIGAEGGQVRRLPQRRVGERRRDRLQAAGAG